jgi:glucose/arabinose dehydrogenase
VTQHDAVVPRFICAALVVLLCAACSTDLPVQSPSPSPTASVRSSPLSTAPRAPGVPVVKAPAPPRSSGPTASPPWVARMPQGTVTYALENGVSGYFNCSNTTMHVSNRSDTAVLELTVTFNLSYENGSTSTALPAQQTATEPAGIAPFADRDVNFKLCVDPKTTAPPAHSISQLDAIPAYFKWVWAS